MARLLTSIFSLLFALHALSQVKCLSSAQTQLAIDEESAYAEGLAAFNDQSEAFAKGAINASRYIIPEITVPVVVHVLYREEENNISYEQIKSQIDVLNRDFAGLNPDYIKVPEAFKGLRGSTKIQFALADKDPDGNFTHGITRTLTTVENIGTETVYHRPERGGVEPWPQPHYMNVWVCELQGNALGFAILPSADMSERDGIVMSPRAFGTMGTAKPPYDHGRTFVHEVAHYFGLRHLWGDDTESCESSDYMSDTPAQLKENYGCKSFPSYSCPDEPDGDMYMNFMDYGNDTCMLMFTQRQVDFMHLVISTNRTALFRSSGYTGISSDEAVQHNMQVYPNPAQDAFYVEFTSGEPKAFEIIDMTGRVLIKQDREQAFDRIERGNLKSGVYMVIAEGMATQLILE